MSEDLDEVARENMGRLTLVLVGVLMMEFGFRLWDVLAPAHWVGVVICLYAYGTALGLFIAALVDVDLERYGHHIGGWCAFVVILATVTIIWLWPGTRFGTDALLFSRYSVDLLLTGRNPFAESMAPAVRIYNADILHVTPQVDGSHVDSLSYPAGMVWAFLPQAVTGVGKGNLAATLLVAAAAVLVFLIMESPPTLAIAPIAVILGARNLVWASAGGHLDAVWVVPLLIAMHYWHRENFRRSSLAYGLAAGTKQTVWPIAPALAIWLWNDAEDLEEFFERAATCIRGGLAGFLVLNLPFMVWDFEAWAYSVFTPISSGVPMIHQGVGPTLLTVADVYALPKDYFTLLTLASFAVIFGVYALYWDRMKWVAWIIPPLVLFWYYRSLNSYFIWFIPIAYYGVLLHLDLRRPRWGVVDAIVDIVVRIVVRWNGTAEAVPENSRIADAYEKGRER